jgi:hypothetical protein
MAAYIAILIDRIIASGGLSRATWLVARKCATAKENIVAFFARMGAFVP